MIIIIIFIIILCFHCFFKYDYSYNLTIRPTLFVKSMACSRSITMVQNELGEITLAKKPTAECKVGSNKEDYCYVILDLKDSRDYSSRLL